MINFCVTRSVIAYWILGLSNLIGYTVLISAAEDILNKFAVGSDENELKSAKHCDVSSTGVIILADIIPSMIAKAIAPFVPLWMNVRILLVVLVGALGFFMVPTANSLLVALTGIALTSFSRGLGESSLLSYTVFFENKSVLSAWSSGTGGAGLLGAVAYAVLTELGVHTETIIYSLLVLPILISICFWGVLENPFAEATQNLERTPIINMSEAPHNISDESFSSRIKKIPLTIKYVVPLFISYYFVYLINQGLFELSLVDSSFFNYKTEYRWYQACYQFGVFISRSSITWLKIDKIWLLALLQVINFIFFSFEALYQFVNNIFIIFAVIVWEGLLSGAAYINTFYKIQTRERAEDQEVMTGITLVADNIGITLSGFTSIFIHNTYCSNSNYS